MKNGWYTTNVWGRTVRCWGQECFIHAIHSWHRHRISRPSYFFLHLCPLYALLVPLSCHFLQLSVSKVFVDTLRLAELVEVFPPLWTSDVPYRFFSVLFTVHLYVILKKINLAHNLFSVYFVNFIYNLYMFRTSPGPSSGGTTVFVRHLVLVLVILYSWLTGMRPSCIPDSQLYRITSTKCRTNTVVPPDDGPGEVRNM